MSALESELDTACSEWLERGWPRPQAIVVTGSTLGGDLGPVTHGPMPLAELVPFPIVAVEGHVLSVEIVEPIAGRPVLYLRGRLHCYQGFSPHQVVFAIRLGILLGAGVLLLTNAAGSLREDWPPGSLALVDDHLNLSGLTPLLGELPGHWGLRFPAMNDAYDAGLRAIARAGAEKAGIQLGSGTYAWLLGPSFETAAEIRMLRTLGADLVGMSTVPEVLAARHMGARCVALSMISNLAAGMSATPPHHSEVMEAAELAAADLSAVLLALLRHPELCQPLETRHE